MKTPGLFEPVYGRSIASIPDWYFDVGLTQAFVITGATYDGKKEVTLHQHSPSFLVTALKVASYFLVVLPLVMLAAKVLVRAMSSFRVVTQENGEQANQSQKKNARDPLIHLLNATTKYGREINGRSNQITLRKFKEATPQEKQNLISEYWMADFIKELEKEKGVKFSQFLDRLPPNVLDILTLADVSIPWQYSPLVFAEYSDEQFAKLTCDSINDQLTKEQHAFIRRRIGMIPDENRKLGADPAKWPLVELPKIDARTIKENYKQIKAPIFAFFSNDQIKELKLSDLTKEQIAFLFKFCELIGIESLYFSPPDGIKAKERLALFADEDIAQAINENKLFDGFGNLSEKQLKLIKLPNLTREQFKTMFLEMGRNHSGRFAHFPAKDVQTALEKGLVKGTDGTFLFSGPQLKGLNFSKLSKETVEGIFQQVYADKGIAAQKERFAFLESSTVNELLQSGKLSSPYHLGLLSETHLKNLKLSKLTKDQVKNLFPRNSREGVIELITQSERFGLLDPREVKAAFESGALCESAQLVLVSPNQLQLFDKKQAEKIFSICKSDDRFLIAKEAGQP